MSVSKENKMITIVNRMVEVSRQLSFHPQGPEACRIELPSRSNCVDIMHQLRSVLFPGFFQLYEYSEERIGFHVGAMMDRIAINLQEQIRRGFCFNCKNEGDMQTCDARAERITDSFLARIPDIMLKGDEHKTINGIVASLISIIPVILLLITIRFSYDRDDKALIEDTFDQLISHHFLAI